MSPHQLSATRPPSAALKSSPSRKGRGALLAVKPPGPTAAFSASQIPSEREDAPYDLRGARSYPTLEDEGDQQEWCIRDGGGGCHWGRRRPGGLRREGAGSKRAVQGEDGDPEAGLTRWEGLDHSQPPQSKICSHPGRGREEQLGLKVPPGEVTAPVTSLQVCRDLEGRSQLLGPAIPGREGWGNTIREGRSSMQRPWGRTWRRPVRLEQSVQGEREEGRVGDTGQAGVWVLV